MDTHDENSPFDAIDVHLVWKKMQLIKHIMVVNDKVNSLNVLTAIYFFPGICIEDIPKDVHILALGIRF